MQNIVYCNDTMKSSKLFPTVSRELLLNGLSYELVT